MRKPAEWRVRLAFRANGIKYLSLTQRCANYPNAQAAFDRLEKLVIADTSDIAIREVVLTHKGKTISRRKDGLTVTDETALSEALGKSTEHIAA